MLLWGNNAGTGFSEKESHIPQLPLSLGKWKFKKIEIKKNLPTQMQRVD